MGKKYFAGFTVRPVREHNRLMSLNVKVGPGDGGYGPRYFITVNYRTKGGYIEAKKTDSFETELTNGIYRVFLGTGISVDVKKLAATMELAKDMFSAKSSASTGSTKKRLNFQALENIVGAADYYHLRDKAMYWNKFSTRRVRS